MTEEERFTGEDETTVGAVIGFRIVEDAGAYFLAEAEIAPYLDEPEELGVTLVFHPLEGFDPATIEDEVEWPSWPLDIDDDVEVDASRTPAEQFASIVRFLHDLGESQVRAYLRRAREDTGGGGT